MDAAEALILEITAYVDQMITEYRDPDTDEVHKREIYKDLKKLQELIKLI